MSDFACSKVMLTGKKSTP